MCLLVPLLGFADEICSMSYTLEHPRRYHFHLQTQFFQLNIAEYALRYDKHEQVRYSEMNDMCNSVFVCSGGHRISHCLHSGVGYGISSSVSNFRICGVCSFVAIFDLTKAVLLHDTAICFPSPFHPFRSTLRVLINLPMSSRHNRQTRLCCGK